MASSAEIGNPAGREMTRIEDSEIFGFSRLYSVNVVCARTVAALASNPWYHLTQLETISRRGGGRMAPETSRQRRLVHPVPHSFFEQRRRPLCVPHGDVERPGFRVVTHTTLIKKASIFQHEGLANPPNPIPDRPPNGC